MLNKTAAWAGLHSSTSTTLPSFFSPQLLWCNSILLTFPTADTWTLTDLLCCPSPNWSCLLHFPLAVGLPSLCFEPFKADGFSFVITITLPSPNRKYRSYTHTLLYLTLFTLMLFTLTLLLSSANLYKRGAGNHIIFILVLPLVISQIHSFESQKHFNFQSKFPFYSCCISLWSLWNNILILDNIQKKKKINFVSLNSTKCVIFFQTSSFPQRKGWELYTFFHYFIFSYFFYQYWLQRHSYIMLKMPLLRHPQTAYTFDFFLPPGDLVIHWLINTNNFFQLLEFAWTLSQTTCLGISMQATAVQLTFIYF